MISLIHQDVSWFEISYLDCVLLTDNQDMRTAVNEGNFDKFPGMSKAIMDGMRVLEGKRIRANLITYINCRLQVWAKGFDADPTPPVRIIPNDISVHPY